MNLLEHYIIDIVSVEDCTDEFVEYMKKDGKPNFKAEEPYYNVEILADCYGRIGRYKQMWRKSELERNKKAGKPPITGPSQPLFP